MFRYRPLLLASLPLFMAGAASAADMPSYVPVEAVVPAPSDWSGCYVGASVGFISPKTTRTPISGDSDLEQSIDLGNVPGSLRPDGDGIIVGPQVGCNIQLDRIVLGGELDISFVDAEREASTTLGVGVTTEAFEDLKYLGTARARIGYAFDNLLLFASGGLAFGEVDLEGNIFSDIPGAPVLHGSSSDVRLGFAVGAGLEYAFTQNWSLKAEYLYYDLGDETLDLETIEGAPDETGEFEFETNGHIGRIGVAYRF